MGNTVYYKIIGKNEGNYPYRVGLNTLKHNNEEFNESEACTSGGLYYTTKEHIHDYLGYGDRVCIITIPKGAKQVKIDNKFKSDKIVIEQILSLNDKSTVEMLFSEYYYSNSAFAKACEYGHIEIVKFLLKYVNVWMWNNHPIKVSSQNGHLDVVKFLVENGAKVRADASEAFKLASSGGHLEVVKFLIENGADVKAEGMYALRRAFDNNHIEVIKYIIEENGVDIVNYLVEKNILVKSNDGTWDFDGIVLLHSEILKLLNENYNNKVITPFVLSISHPDYKRPWTERKFGCNINEARSYLYNEIYNRLYLSEESGTFEEYIDNYYNYGYMDQDPYTLHFFNTETNTWYENEDMIKSTFNLVMKNLSHSSSSSNEEEEEGEKEEEEEKEVKKIKN